MNSGTLATLGVTIFLAFAGYVVTYLNNLRLARRKDRLNRINQQLSDLYGPLLSLTSAADATWAAFRTLYRPEGGSFWDSEHPPNDEEAAAWRFWIEDGFMPLNRKMMDTIVEGAHLLEGTEVPASFLSLSAHVINYGVLIQQWKRGDLSRHVPVHIFPAEDLEGHVWRQFNALKAEQAELLGGVKSRTSNKVS